MAFAQSALQQELVKMKRAELAPSTVYINQFESDWTEQQAPSPSPRSPCSNIFWNARSAWPRH
ncbi:hypothetical protein QNM99_04340 [Pseudomonas sp. PCH446]